MASDVKAVLVKRQTRLEQLIAQYNTEEQARFVIESRGGDFQDYRQEHHDYHIALHSVQRDLRALARIHVLEREFLPNYVFGPDDVVVVVGQDGLVANTLKYLQGQPVIAINPDPARFDGVLLPFKVTDVSVILKSVIKQSVSLKPITMARMTLNDGQTLLAVNDFFIGPRYPISARYKIINGKRSEIQSSSGIIISTGLGATGWLKSVVAGAAKIAGVAIAESNDFAWDSHYLRFAVREPFPSQMTGVELTYGVVDRSHPLSIESHMAAHGVIFSDGMYDDSIEFNSGAIAKITVAEHQAKLVVG